MSGKRRIACVQFDIKLRQPTENLRVIKILTDELKTGSLDLLVLPEMCLSGYVFASAEEIMPYLEESVTGPTGRLAINLATRLQCYVVAGYPEKCPKVPGQGVGYTSALIVGPAGDVVGNYRKSSLFEMDKCWAREGSGFMYFNLPKPLGRMGIAMCMDLNPRDFTAPWESYEVGTFAQHNQLDTLVVPMNWLATHTPDGYHEGTDDSRPHEETLKYWAARMSPLHHPTSPGILEKPVVFITCNNVGTQEGIKFIGTSCVMRFSTKAPFIEVIDAMSVTEEAVMLADV